MVWNLILIGMFLIAAVITGLALMTGSGHPRRRRTH